MTYYRYPRIVDKHSITTVTDKDNERRYILALKLKKRGSERLLIIIDSMGAADEIDSDRKLCRILKYIQESRELQPYGELRIMSLFPVCSSKIKYLIEKLYEKGPEFILGEDDLFILEDRVISNKMLIKENIDLADKIILAWGSPPVILKKYHHNVSEELLAYIKTRKKSLYTYTIGELSLRGYPKSCLCWSYKEVPIAYPFNSV